MTSNLPHLYIAACKLPPSVERTTLLDGLVTMERQALLSTRAARIHGLRTRHVVINGEVFETTERRYLNAPEWLQ